MLRISEFKYLFSKDKRILFYRHFSFSKYIKDEKYLKLLYKAVLNRELNLDSPSTFGEKLQWLKLNNRDSRYTIMVDKIAAKEYVANILGSKYIIPNIAVWDDPKKINFELLPDKFVLKCNHNSGIGMCICKNKKELDKTFVLKQLKKGLREDFYSHSREWPYKDVNRKVFAEQFMENKGDSELIDYKFYCFNGEPCYCQVIKDRTSRETIDFFDMDWNIQEFTGLEKPYKEHSKFVKKPDNFLEMIEGAKKLSEGIPFLRVDFYEINGQVYFGEMTFYPASGLGWFTPDSWNYKLGKMIRI